MSKREKKLERKALKEWRRNWERAQRGPMRLAARVKLALSDDAGVEKAIRKVWRWADDQLVGQEDVATKGSLQKLQTRMAEGLDVLGNLLGVDLERFPEPTLTSRAPATRSDDTAARKARADEVARELLKDPEVRRGYEAAQKASRDGTFGLSDEQRQVAARLGITDRVTLAKLSSQMVKAQLAALAGGAPPKPSAPTALTPELQKFFRRLGIAAPDPKAVAEMADSIRSRFGFELKSA